MAWFSLLPENMSTVENWIVRIFLLLGFLTIAPWAFLIIYDFVYYLCRLFTYDVPVVGGRARGKLRPRAPSLTERPDGSPRRFSIATQRRDDDVGRARTTGADHRRIKSG